MSGNDAQAKLAALVEAGIALAAEPQIDELLQRIADLARDVLGARFAAVGTLDEGGSLARFVHSGIDAATVEAIGQLPTGAGVLGAIIEEGRPLRLREISDHKRSVGFPPHHPEMHTFLGVPILAGRRVFGRLYLAEKLDGDEFTKDDERIAMTFAAQAGVAVENARLRDALKDLAVLEERERISKELHDGVIQSIYSVGLSLQAALSLIQRDPEMSKTRIDQSINELDNVVRDVRSYIFELRPKMVEERGLAAAIAELARDSEVNTLADTQIDLAPEAHEALTDTQQLHVVQIVREILSNIARHARARHVHIALRKEDDEISICIEDDGIGFDADAVERGHGLANIDERARLLGGSLVITPRDPAGTTHRVAFPLTAEER